MTRRAPMPRVLLAVLMALTAPAWATGAEPQELAGAVDLARLAGSLILILIAILVLAKILHSFAANPPRLPGNAIEILAIRQIGARERLLLVQVGEEQLLLGVGSNGIQTLHRLRQPIEVPAAGAQAPSFAGVFRQVLSSRRAGR